MQKLQHRISKKLVTILFIFLALPISAFLVQQARGVQGASHSVHYTVYEDVLTSGWHARSRASRINLANPSPVYSGSRSISFTPTGRGARLYLYTTTAVDTSLYTSLHFAAQASRARQDYIVTLYDGANRPLSTVRLTRYGGDPVPGSWKVYDIPLRDLRANATHIRGVAIQSRSHRYATLYLDSISLTGLFSSQTPTPTSTSTPTPTPMSTPTPTPTPSATPVPATSIKTVFMIVMENNNWSTIKGNSSAPYINNTLLPQASYATQYFNPPGKHPSEPNYLWLEAGTNLGVSNDNPPSNNHQKTTAHLVTLLQNAGLSWKAYEEGIDGNTCPLVDSYPYATKHNPMIFFDNVTGTNNPNSAYCIAHERPYTDLATDLQNNTVANYNFITPNLCDDMHDSCSPTHNGIKQGDTWLSHEVPTILNSQAYKNGGALFITWDEGEHGSDGPIGMIVLSPYAKGNGYSNTIHYSHSSTLRTMQEIFHVTPFLGDAANAVDLSDLFVAGTFNTVTDPSQPSGCDCKGTVYYVDNSSTGCSGAPCSNSNTGTTPNTAWRTISHVQNMLSSLHPDDGVLFKRGDVWNEELDLNNVHGSPGHQITFGNYGSGPLPVIDGGSSRANCIAAINTSVSYVTIDGFECRNTTQHGMTFQTSNGKMPGIIVQNSRIHNTGPGACAGCGIPHDTGGYLNQLDFEDFSDGADGVRFLNNIVNHCGGHNCVNIHYDTGGPIIRRNIVGPGCVHDCIDVKGSVGGIVDQNIATSGGGTKQDDFYSENTETAHEDITYTRNVAYNSPIGFHIENGGSCTHSPCSIVAHYYNNTVYQSSNQVNIEDTSCRETTFDIRNNILDGGAIDIHGGCSVTWDYNDDGGSQGFAWVDMNDSSTSPKGSHDLSNADPQYVNVVSADFHLKSNSPVIGRALAHLVASMTDMGAYQHDTITPVPTAPQRTTQLVPSPSISDTPKSISFRGNTQLLSG